jgi:hypothetical protein
VLARAFSRTVRQDNRDRIAQGQANPLNLAMEDNCRGTESEILVQMMKIGAEKPQRGMEGLTVCDSEIVFVGHC